MSLSFRSPLSLFVSLPRNDVDLARAAIDGGAEALKVHINVGHRASGTAFGRVADEGNAIEAICGLGVPVGVVVGGEGSVDLDEVRAVRALGVAFFDVYAHHAPGWYVDEAPPGGALVALRGDEAPARAAVLARLGVDAIEASLASPEEYGTPLHVERLADITRLVQQTELPVVVPTQHAITPEDVAALRRTGAAALLLGAVVTRDSPNTVEQVTARFRTAIDAPRGR